MSGKIIAWDLGTGGNKASLYDENGCCLAAAFEAYPTYYPQHGFHEQKPDDWWRAIIKTTGGLLQESGTDPREIEACGISGHSLGTVLLDAQGELLAESSPIWSDGRAVQEAERFFRTYPEETWYRITGNGFSPQLYTIFKLLWYQEHMPDIFRRTVKVIGTKDYINYRLTGRIVTDHSYASGSGVYDLKKWKYSDELIQAFQIQKSLFPDISPSTEVIGVVTEEAAALTGLCAGTKVVCGGVDNSCMALGAMAYKENRAYMNLGSSNWIAVSSREPILSFHSRPYVFAHVLPDMYASALCISAGGTSFRWVRDELCKDLKAEADQKEISVYELLNREAEKSSPGANKVLFNPSLGGGMPYDQSMQIRGAYMGLDLGTTRADLIRSAMEGIAMAMKECFNLLKELGAAPDELLLAGGGSKSPLWCRIFADCLKIPMLKSDIDEQAAALGAAAVAAVGIGMWSDFEKIDGLHHITDIYRPLAEQEKLYDQLYKIYLTASEHQSEIGDMLTKIITT